MYCTVKSNVTKNTVTKSIITAAALFLLAACSSRLPDTTEQSGFLSDYQRLNEENTVSGNKIKAWTSTEFRTDKPETKLIFTHVSFRPLNKNNQMGKQFMAVLLNYTNQQIKQELAKHYTLTETAAPGVLHFSGVITSVSLTNKEIKPYEVLPVMLIIAGTQLAVGNRDVDTNLFFEWKITESVTKMAHLEAIRKNNGVQLSNKQQQITLDDLKEAVDTIAAEILPASPYLKRS